MQGPALCFMVACVLCDRVFERVANLGMHREHHSVAIGLNLASETNGFPCCAEAGSDEARGDNVLCHIRTPHMPDRPYMCVGCGITTASFMTLCT